MVNKEKMERLAHACMVVLRQWERGPVGHDAVLELHRALKGVVPELRRTEVDRIDAVTPIVCKYSCEGCGLKRVEVRVPSRPAEMDVVVWVQRVAAGTIMADHAIRSPKCGADKMAEVMIPITGAPYVGAPSIS